MELFWAISSQLSAISSQQSILQIKHELKGIENK